MMSAEDATGLTREDARGVFKPLSSIAYQRDSSRGNRNPVEPLYHIEVGSRMRCTDPEYTPLDARSVYTVLRLWGELSKQHCFIEVADTAGNSLGEYGLWRFIPVNQAIESGAEEYEEVLKETQVMDTLQD